MRSGSTIAPSKNRALNLSRRTRSGRPECAERGEAAEHRAIAQRNGERIEADPDLALNALTQQQSTFARQDLARFVDRHTDGAEQFTRVMARVEASAEIVRLG